MIPATVCLGTAYPSILHIMSHRTDSHNQGYILGFASTALGVAWMVTGVAAGPATASGFSTPNIISAACILTATIIIQVGVNI